MTATLLPCRVCGAQPGIPCRDLVTGRRAIGRTHPGRLIPLVGWPPRRGLLRPGIIDGRTFGAARLRALIEET